MVGRSFRFIANVRFGALTTAAVVLCAPLITHAGGFALLEQTASGVGDAYAGVGASGDDVSAMYFNPATLSLLGAPQAALGIAAIDIQAKFDDRGSTLPAAGAGLLPRGSTHDDAGDTIPLPSAYFGMPFNDRLAFGLRVRVVDTDRIIIGADTLVRRPAQEARVAPVTTTKPSAASREFASLIGEYGWDHNVLYIREKDGKLNALIEWFFEYPLERVSRDVYRFPAFGLYDSQEIVFRRDARGIATTAVAGTVPFVRRPLPGDDDRVSFRITPVRSPDELRRDALAVSRPKETRPRAPDLVELRSLDASIKYDIRYATSNNFMGVPFYTSAHAFMQRPAAEAVARAAAELKKLGFGLLIHDSYRPWYVTKMFWDGTPPDKHMFVADPSQGSRHNRGCAVDLTLYDLKTGAPIRMTGGYDEMSDRSYPLYPGGTSAQRWHRDLLRHVMEAQGFDVIDTEWWHFDYRDWREYPIGNLTFEQLSLRR